jgi:hypothetical protein
MWPVEAPVYFGSFCGLWVVLQTQNDPKCRKRPKLRRVARLAVGDDTDVFGFCVGAGIFSSSWTLHGAM